MKFIQMKKYLIIVVSVLLAACNSDESDSPTPNNAPSGALVRVETYFPLGEVQINVTNFFDANGRIASSLTEETGTSINSSYTSEYLYNQQGQIWKLIHNSTFNTYDEFQFTNGLITQSTTHKVNGEIFYKQFLYNDQNQLTHIQYLNVDNVEGATYDITFNDDGNILNTYLGNDGSFTEYTYEYDNHNNPYSILFNNQEIRKVLEYNFNNKTKRIYSRNIGTRIFTREYTYNDANYPTSFNEYMDGDLVTQVTFIYQE